MSELFPQQVGRYAEQAGSKLTTTHKNENVIEVTQEKLKEFLGHLVNDLSTRHLMTITGLDLGQNIQIIYNFSHERDTVHVKTNVPKTKPVALSIIDIVPGAILYEMEVHDMLGVYFTGNPWMDRKLLLPDEWPSDLPPPLLKTSRADEIRKRLDLGVAKQ